MRKVLRRSFFNRPTLRVAKDLLGKYLVRRIGTRKIACKITEVEAYVGFRDRASHASRGQTDRNKVMFGRPGAWYVYFTYGRHWMLNIVTERKGYPAAILIRGTQGVSGPGRVTKFFKINKRFNAKFASPQTGLWIEDRGVKIPKSRIKRLPRVGVEYAGRWRHKLWRFYLFVQNTALLAARMNGYKQITPSFRSKRGGEMEIPRSFAARSSMFI